MSQRILELYSGIGGMHAAWNESGQDGEIVAAVDINTVANHVYSHNYKKVTVMNKNIQSLNPELLRKLNINTILMSPPCQPFTRNGKTLHEGDPRTDSFIYILKILSKMDFIKYILLENVKGFEISAVHQHFLKTLVDCSFDYREFLLTPTTFGVPNSRLRYYCIARRKCKPWDFESDGILENITKTYGEPFELGEIIEDNVGDKFLVPEKFIKRANIFDICYKQSRRSCCFTKAYSHYIEGTGSLFTESSPEFVKSCYDKANEHEIGSEEFVQALLPIKFRFFSPREVLSLMQFPEHYTFPEDITLKQCYRLLGNSVNVKVIAELINILFSSYIFFSLLLNR